MRCAKKWNSALSLCTRAATAAMALALSATSSYGQCGGTMLATPSPSTNFVVGQSLEISATFGPVGNSATINAVIVNLECQNAGGCSLPCVDDGMVLQYNGDDTIAGNTCGQALSTGLGNGNTFTNMITFTFAAPINLASGATCSFRFGVTIASLSNDATPKQITGTVQTSGQCSNGLPLAACGSYLITLVTPMIHIEKDVTPPGPICSGTQVKYSYVVTNPGDVPLSNVVVVDDNGTPGNMADDFNPTFVGGDTNMNNILEPSETWTYTHSATPAVGTTTNIATVGGDFVNAVGTTTVTDTDDAVIVVNPRPNCSIETTPGTCQTMYCVTTNACMPFTVTWTGPGNFMQTGPCITLGAANAAGTYSAVVTDCNQCTSTGPCQIMFTPPVAPSCSIGVSDCPFPRTLTVNPSNCSGCTFAWRAGSCGTGGTVLGTSNTLSVDAPGTFHVDLTATNGCTGCCSIVVEACQSGGQGRTPGFWKQVHHFGHWPAPYCAANNCPCGPATLFCNVFDCTTAGGCQTAVNNAYAGKTLLQVLQQGGGGFQALGRHAVAGLLNSAHNQIDYAFTTQQVIDMVNNAIDTCNPGPAHTALAEQNELEGGPLGGQLYCNSPFAGQGSLNLDLNVDGHVNTLDLTWMLQHFGHPSTDVNHDGVVNSTDVVIMTYWATH